MARSFLLPRYDLRRAGRALSALLRDPDDLPQVFKIIDSFSGTAPHRLLFRFKRTESGVRILRERPDILARLVDRAALRALPAGSLGRAYLDFVESEGISPEGIRAASLAGHGGQIVPPVYLYLRGRMRDTHDLWHTVTGYKGDVLGELSLLGFILGQNWNTGVALIVGTALLRGRDARVSEMIRQGYRRGRASAWLPAQEWESLLALPLEEVRARLALGTPPAYVPVRTSDIRAMMRVPPPVPS